MSHRPSLDLLSLAVHVNDADAKMMEVILQTGAHFTSSGVTA
jgi:hypothetical protein